MECKFFALHFLIGRTTESQHFTLASRRFYPFLMKSKRVNILRKPDKPTEPQQDFLPGIPDGNALKNSTAKLLAPSWTSLRLPNRLDGSTLGTIPASFHISEKSRTRPQGRNRTIFRLTRGNRAQARDTVSYWLPLGPATVSLKQFRPSQHLGRDPQSLCPSP